MPSKPVICIMLTVFPCMALIKGNQEYNNGRSWSCIFALKEMARLMRVYHRKYKECINQVVVVETRPFTMTDLGAKGYGKSARMMVYAQNHKTSTFKLSKNGRRNITKSVH